MAIRLEDIYAYFVAADADYPGGSFKNTSTAGGSDGTPLEKQWANDLLGARDAILAAAGRGYSGAPDTAQASDTLEALKTLFVLAADAVSAATASKVIKRDTNGRARVANGVADDDIATVAQVAARALLGGSAAQKFKVAAATAADEAVRLGQFGGSFAESGYATLPGGLIVQWGKASSINNGTAVTFPTAFPTACINVQTTQISDTTSDFNQNVRYNYSTTGFTYGTSSVGSTGFWFAVGY